MSYMDALFQREKSLLKQKQERLSEISEAKKNYLDPGWRDLPIDSNTVKDADTARFGNQELRLVGSRPGHAPNAFETSPEAYAFNPERLSAHRKAYAERYGRPVEKVSIDDLVAEGLNQKELASGKMVPDTQFRLQDGKKDEYGRYLTEIRTPEGENLGDTLSAQPFNAGYGSKYNYAQRGEDLDSGAWKKQYDATRDRTLGEKLKDSAVTLGSGIIDVGQIGLDLAGMVDRNLVTGPINKGLNALSGGIFPDQAALDAPIRNANAWIDEKQKAYNEAFRSGAILGQDRLREEYLASQKQAAPRKVQERLDAGYSLPEARVLGVVDEVLTTGESLIERPGLLVNKIIETLPTMLPVAAVGRAAYLSKAKELMAKGVLLTSKEGTEMLAKAGGKAAATAGVAAIGVTEGGSVGLEVRQDILSKEFTELEQTSERYRKLLENNSPEQARNKLANEGGDLAAVITGVLAAGISKVTGAAGFEGRLLTPLVIGSNAQKVIGELASKVGSGAVGKAASTAAMGGARLLGNTAKETIEEGLQEGTGALVGNVAEQQLIDKEKDILEDVGRGIGEGAVIGAGMGLGAGAVSGTVRNLAQAKEALGGMTTRPTAPAGNRTEEIAAARAAGTAKLSAEEIAAGEVSVDADTDTASLPKVEEYASRGSQYFRENSAELVNFERAYRRDFFEAAKAKKAAQDSGDNAGANAADEQLAVLRAHRKAVTEATVGTEAQAIVGKILGSPDQEIELTPSELDTVVAAFLSGNLSAEDTKTINRAKIPESYKQRIGLYSNLNASIEALEGAKKHSPKVQNVLEEKFGYLAPSLSEGGTGLKLGLMGHLERIDGLIASALRGENNSKVGQITNQLNSLNTFVKSQFENKVKPETQKLLKAGFTQEQINEAVVAHKAGKPVKDKALLNIARFRTEQEILNTALVESAEGYNNNALADINAARKALNLNAESYQPYDVKDRLGWLKTDKSAQKNISKAQKAERTKSAASVQSEEVVPTTKAPTTFESSKKLKALVKRKNNLESAVKYARKSEVRAAAATELETVIAEIAAINAATPTTPTNQKEPTTTATTTQGTDAKTETVPTKPLDEGTGSTGTKKQAAETTGTDTTEEQATAGYAEILDGSIASTPVGKRTLRALFDDPDSRIDKQAVLAGDQKAIAVLWTKLDELLGDTNKTTPLKTTLLNARVRLFEKPATTEEPTTNTQEEQVAAAPVTEAEKKANAKAAKVINPDTGNGFTSAQELIDFLLAAYEEGGDVVAAQERAAFNEIRDKLKLGNVFLVDAEVLKTRGAWLIETFSPETLQGMVSQGAQTLITAPDEENEVDYYVWTGSARGDATRRLHGLSHELGHVVDFLHFERLKGVDPDLADRITAAFNDYKASISPDKAVTPAQIRAAMFGSLEAVGETNASRDINSMAWFETFIEWKAERIAFWMKSKEAPTTPENRYFAGLGNFFKTIISAFKKNTEEFNQYNKGYSSIAEWMDGLFAVEETASSTEQSEAEAPAASVVASKIVDATTSMETLDGAEVSLEDAAVLTAAELVEQRKELENPATKAERLEELKKSIGELSVAQATRLNKLESKERARVEKLFGKAAKQPAKIAVPESFDAVQEALEETERDAPVNRDFETLNVLRDQVVETFEVLNEEDADTVGGVSKANLEALEGMLNNVAARQLEHSLAPTPETREALDSKYDATNFALNKMFSLLAREEAKRGAEQLLEKLEPKDNSFKEVLDALIVFGAADNETRTKQTALIKRLVDGFTNNGGNSEQVLAEVAVDVMAFFQENKGSHARQAVALMNRYIPEIPGDPDMPRQDTNAVGIDAYLSVGNKAARSILGMFPAAHALLAKIPGLKALMPEGMELTLSRHRGKVEFMAFRDQFDKVLHEEILSAISNPRLEDNRTFERNGSNRIREDFDAAPIHGLRNKDTELLNSNVVTAMAAEMLAWLGTTGATTLTVNGVDQVKQILGVERLDDPRAAMQALKHVGSLRDVVAAAIGKPVVRKHLGLVRNEASSVDAFFESRLEMSIGLAAVVAMEKMNLLDIQTMPNKTFQALKGIELKNDDKTQVNFIKLKTISENGRTIRAPQVVALGETYKRARYLLEKVFNVENAAKLPFRDDQNAEVKYVEKKIRGSSTRVDSTTAEAVGKIQSYKLKLQPQTKTLFEAFPDTETFKTAVMGYQDINQATEREKNGVEGLNLSIDREVETYQDMLADSQESYRFKYSVKRNMRSMIESTGLNPHSGKGLHRVAVFDESWTDTIGTKDLKRFVATAENGTFEDVPESLREFLSATAFALDIKVAYDPQNGTKYAAQGVDKSVEDSHLWRGVWNKVTAVDGAFVPALKALKDRETRGDVFTAEETAVIRKAVQDGGQKMWSLVALDTWKNFEAALEASRTGEASFENRMPMEVDGLTNGPAIVLMQIPSQDKTRRWTMNNRVGVFGKNQPIKSFAQLLRADAAALDNYQEFGKMLHERIKEALNNPQSDFLEDVVNNTAVKIKDDVVEILTPGLIHGFLTKINAFSESTENTEIAFTDVLVDADGNITKYARNMGKNPIMTSAAYGAGPTAVANQIAVENPYDTPALEMFYAKLKKVAYNGLPVIDQAKIIQGMIRLVAESVAVDRSKNGEYARLSDEGRKQFDRRFSAAKEQAIPELKDITGKGVTQFVKEFLLVPEVEKALQNRIKVTYGAAANEAIAEMFGYQQTVRGEINTALAFIAKVNEEMFKKKYLEEVARNGNKPLTMREMEKIKKELISEGWGTVIPHANSEVGKPETYLDFSGDSEVLAKEWLVENKIFKKDDKRLEALTKTDLAVRSGLKRQKPIFDEDTNAIIGFEDDVQQAVTAETRIRLPNADEIRLKGFVRLIQSMDAAIMADIYGKYPILHVFDAFIAGTGMIREVSTFANQTFFNRNQKYNLVDEIHTKFKKTLDRLESAEGSKFFTQNEIDNIKAYPFGKTDEIMDNFAPMFEKTNSDNLELKKEMFSEVGAVNQFGKDNSPYEPINIILGSSEQREAVSGDSVEVYQSVLQQDNLRDILGKIEEFENIPLSPEHNAQLEQLTELVLLPGMAHVDDIILKVIRNPQGTINRGSMAASGLVPTQINVISADNVLTSPGRMSLKEVTVHEMTHAVLYAFIEGSGNAAARRSLEELFDKAAGRLTPDDLLVDPATATAAERTLAQARYEYIFHNPEGHRLHEFAAIGLTNETFAKALAKLPISKKADFMSTATNVNAWMANPLKQLLTVLLDALSWLGTNRYQSRSGSVGSALFNLAKTVVALNSQNSERVTERLSEYYVKAAQRVNTGIQDLAVQGAVLAAGQGLQSPTEARKTLENAKAYMTFAKGIWDEAQAGSPVAEVTSGFKFGREVVQEIVGLSERDNRNIRNLKRRSDTMVDTLRDHVHTTITKQLRAGFGRALKKNESRGANEVLLRTDLSSLLVAGFTLNTIKDIIFDPQQRTKEIKRLVESLRQDFGRNGIAYSHQAKNLGLLISAGQIYRDVKMPQTNAHNIAQLRMFAEEAREPVGDLQVAETRIDALASLYALDQVDPMYVANIWTLLEEEFARTDGNGIANALESHLAFKSLSLETNFGGNKLGTFKGYTAETFDENMVTEFRPATPEWDRKMLNQGFKRVAVVERDTLHKRLSGEPGELGMYVSTLGLARWRKSILSKTNPHGKGSSVTEDMVERLGVLGKTRGKALVDALTTRGYRAALRQFDPKLDTETREHGTLVPSLSQITGKPADFRYMMADKFKVKYLKRDDALEDNLGKMFAGISDKANTLTINRELIDAAHKDWIELRNSNKDLFTYIGLDAVDASSRDVFKMFPEDAREYAARKFISSSKNGTIKGMYIRKDLFNYMLGFREVSVTGALHGLDQSRNMKRNTTTKVPLHVWSALRIGEDVWKEVVTFARLKTSVLLPDVVFGNLLSNVLVLAADGIPPDYILKTAREGIAAMRDYRRTREKRDNLAIQLLGQQAQGRPAPRLEAELKALTQSLEANPVRDMIQEGMFLSIVEDVSPEAFRASPNQPMQRLFQNLTGPVAESNPRVEKALNIGRELLMSPGSRTFGLAMAANQYGDFVARYILYNHDLKIKKLDRQTAIDKSMDYFIYYNEPTNKHMAAVNDYGVFMFWKFYARIQRVVLRLFKEKPGTAMLAAGLDHLFLGDVGITGYFGNVSKAWNRVDIVPDEAIGKAMGFPIFDWIKLAPGI